VTAPRISVVIATKDRAAFLEGALASFAAQQGAPAFEVVVVDNGSSDRTREVASRYGERSDIAVRYAFVAEPNRGAARNAGIAIAQGAIVAFVDDDVVVPPGFLAAHAAAHAGSLFPAAVSGPILNVPDAAARPKPSGANYSRAFFCTCNVSVPRSALIAAGNFDERFNLYGWEDTELGLRLRRRDVRRVFAWPTASISCARRSSPRPGPSRSSSVWPPMRRSRPRCARSHARRRSTSRTPRRCAAPWHARLRRSPVNSHMRIYR
jgi:glycosyltransferase involved in cell wall biosynthesis